MLITFVVTDILLCEMLKVCLFWVIGPDGVTVAFKSNLWVMETESRYVINIGFRFIIEMNNYT